MLRFSRAAAAAAARAPTSPPQMSVSASASASASASTGMRSGRQSPSIAHAITELRAPYDSPQEAPHSRTVLRALWDRTDTPPQSPFWLVQRIYALLNARLPYVEHARVLRRSSAKTHLAKVLAARGRAEPGATEEQRRLWRTQEIVRCCCVALGVSHEGVRTVDEVRRRFTAEIRKEECRRVETKEAFCNPVEVAGGMTPEAQVASMHLEAFRPEAIPEFVWSGQLSGSEWVGSWNIEHGRILSGTMPIGDTLSAVLRALEKEGCLPPDMSVMGPEQMSSFEFMAAANTSVEDGRTECDGMWAAATKAEGPFARFRNQQDPTHRRLFVIVCHNQHFVGIVLHRSLPGVAEVLDSNGRWGEGGGAEVKRIKKALQLLRRAAWGEEAAVPPTLLYPIVPAQQDGISCGVAVLAALFALCRQPTARSVVNAQIYDLTGDGPEAFTMDAARARSMAENMVWWAVVGRDPKTPLSPCITRAIEARHALLKYCVMQLGTAVPAPAGLSGGSAFAPVSRPISVTAPASAYARAAPTAFPPLHLPAPPTTSSTYGTQAYRGSPPGGWTRDAWSVRQRTKKRGRRHSHASATSTFQDTTRRKKGRWHVSNWL